MPPPSSSSAKRRWPSARNDLAKTTITAPVDGVVISRQVDAGQTVAASLNTPTLFTIAQDLREMQVEVAIDESDIGKIRQAEQRVTFTVDAFAGRTFDGRVRQIRKAAQTVQNVVTYTVVVETPNPNAAAGARHDRERAHHRRQPRQRAEGAECRAALAPGRAPPAPKDDRGACRRRRTGPAAAAVTRRPAAQKLVADLKLDASQQARLDEIFAELRGRMMELREVPEADRRVRGERLRADVRQKINAMLNADQQKHYAEIVAGGNRSRRVRQRPRVRAGPGRQARWKCGCASDSPTATPPKSSAATSRKAPRSSSAPSPPVAPPNPVRPAARRGLPF